MNGTVAQLISLTCHANAFLRGHAAPPFFPGNSTCKFCERIQFVATTKLVFAKLRERSIAPSAEQWFSYLKGKDARGVALCWRSRQDPGLSDRMSSGFVGGGGDWGMEVFLSGDRSQLWMPRWEVWNQNAPERRIWRVTYGCVSTGHASPRGYEPVEPAASELRSALEEIRAFAERHQCEFFASCFAKAIQCLAEAARAIPIPPGLYHPDISPAGLLEESAGRLLAACQFAWVFGAMGSWNDMLFEGEEQREYDRVSERLWQSLCRAICVATNLALKG